MLMNVAISGNVEISCVLDIILLILIDRACTDLIDDIVGDEYSMGWIIELTDDEEIIHDLYSDAYLEPDNQHHFSNWFTLF